ncbi:Nif-specific regulatory protein [uncultured Eubacterium sp.]|nr:Nif-specific regulatory protein [uncultured Eubacterium sp.]
MLIEKYCNVCGSELSLNIPLEDYTFHRILTCNPAMMSQIETIHKISNSSAPVVITGETGTGKELYAEYIHHVSVRQKEKYAKVNCATIPENLFESEMFGYMPGAFTGALKTGKKGIFEIADQGTLFLDEISELSQGLQSKLLRVIQENRFVKVGGSTEITCDVRLIAASNKELQEMVKENAFRKDLFYRLNVVPICLLPLRERREDIILLSFYFLNLFNQTYGTDKKMGVNLMKAFLDYQWPGNVRELRNTVERLILLSDGETLNDERILQATLETETLFLLNDSNVDEFTPARVRAVNPNHSSKSLKEIVAEYELFIIEEYIKKTGSMRKAAAALKTSPSVLSRKLNNRK